MEMWTTKWFDTRGLIKIETSKEFDETRKGFDQNGCIVLGHGSYKKNVDIFINYEEAVQKADELRNEKIESLKKQIKRLEKLNFGEEHGI